MPLPDSPPDTTSTVESDRTSSARWKWLARLVAGAALLAFLVVRGDAATLGKTLARVPLWTLGAGIAWYLGGQVLSAVKWRVLLQARDTKIPLRRCCALYWLGMFSNLWLPGSIGGDAVRVWRLRAHGIGGGVAAASVLLERLTGFAALLSLGVLGLLWTQASIGVTRLLWVSLAAFVAVPFLFVVLRRARSRLDSKLGRKLIGVADAVAFYGGARGRGAVAVSLILSFIFQASQIALGIGLARAIGWNLPTQTFFWLIPVLALASLVPVGIGGLGVREAAAVALVGSAAPAETAIAWSLLWQAVVWLASVPGGWWLVREE
ncbi:MAG TPA: lysylphosphatidylglycerol synthase transmembrane domain-containing protein [Abditibacteriaceae bacterium]|jgi:hypothetical protein